ncbi:MAG: hypothetical protein GF317_09740 [Candidatus Lokiarchaeota archaeon]|nr:hypothetical protein [Candidatus Lokiarchaeota archaeon]
MKKRCPECDAILIENNSGELVCSVCGLVEKSKVFTNTTRPFYDESEFIERTHNTPTFIKGSKVILSRKERNTKLKRLLYNKQAPYKKRMIANLFKALNKFNSYDLFVLNNRSKQCVINIGVKIKQYLIKKRKYPQYIHVILLSLLFYFRQTKIPVIHSKDELIPVHMIRFIELVNENINQQMKPRDILSIIEQLPPEFVNNFKRPTPSSYLYYIFDRIFTGNNCTRMKEAGVSPKEFKTYLHNQTVKFLDENKKINSTNNIHYILKIVLTNIKKYREKNNIKKRLLIYKDLVSHFNISPYTIRQIDLDQCTKSVSLVPE